jgi:hypothetical protein
MFLILFIVYLQRKVPAVVPFEPRSFCAAFPLPATILCPFPLCMVCSQGRCHPRNISSADKQVQQVANKKEGACSDSRLCALEADRNIPLPRSFRFHLGENILTRCSADKNYVWPRRCEISMPSAETSGISRILPRRHSCHQTGRAIVLCAERWICQERSA